MSKDKRRSRDDYNMTDEERRLKKFEPYRKVRKPIPPPSRFFKDKRHKRDKTITEDPDNQFRVTEDVAGESDESEH